MKSLIIYFTYSNNTKNLVEKINQEFSFDVARVEREIPYSSDYDTCAYIEAKKEWENKIYPAIKNINLDINEYERVLLFFPIWWYTFPMPIGTLLKQIAAYKGEIIIFENSYTNDPQYVTNSINDIKTLAPSLNIKQGLFNKSPEKHISFLKGE